MKIGRSAFFAFLLPLTYISIDAQVLWEPVKTPGRVPVWQIVRFEDTYLLKAETGLYRSANEGQTWEFCGETAPFDGYLAAIDSAMLLHANPNNGLYVSTDAGLTWQMIWHNAPPASTGLTANQSYIFYATANGIYRYPINGGGASAILHFPTYQQFASVKMTNGKLWASSNNKLLMSDDNGDNWHEIAVVPNLRCFQPHGDTVLVATSNELLHSENNGQSWGIFDSFLSPIQQLDWQNGCWLALSSEFPVLWSGDGGQTWLPPTTGPFPDYGVEGVVKNGHLWLVASHLGGVLRSPNNGEYWLASTTGITSASPYPPEWLERAGDFLIFNIGFTHLLHSEDNNWFMPLPTSSYDPLLRIVQHKDSYYALSMWGSIFQQELANPYRWIKRSSGYLYNSVFGHGLSTRLHDLGDRMIVTETYDEPDAVYQSLNGGSSWLKVGELPFGARSIKAFDQRLYCLTDDLKCLSSADAGATWTSAGEGLPATWSNDARLDARPGGLLFFDENKMYARTETGQPFFHVPMPTEAISDRIWDADIHNGLLLAATDAGVYSTADWGKSWALIGVNLPEQDFSNAYIRLHQNLAYLLLPKSSVPLWKTGLPLTDIKEVPQKNTVAISPNPSFVETNVVIGLPPAFARENENVEVKIYDAKGALVVSFLLEAMNLDGKIIFEQALLCRGVYHVQIRTGSKIANGKLLKI
jgi:photosystem II stability/assembly factor-like uncharacterized protein